MVQATRRMLLSGITLIGLADSGLARTVKGALPWSPNEAYPTQGARPGPWLFLTAEEAVALDAIVARLIPADDLGPGAKEAGCTVFIDRQLAGPFGGHDWLYMEGPFPANSMPSQGLQSPLTPRQQYRQGLAALDSYCKTNFANRSFVQLGNEEQDRLLTGLETNEVKLPGFDGRMLFTAVYANTMEGFFADPVYGGNRDMAGWKLVGFPGTRYDYRDVMQKPNVAYDVSPVALMGRPAWKQPA